MHYHISRNGQNYGPYTLEDLQRYLASGNILPSDLAKSDEMTDWVPVSQIIAGQAEPVVPPASPAGGYTPVSSPQQPYADPTFYPPVAAINPALAASPYEDAPNLHWGLVLLFAFLTCGFFMYVWNLIVAAWLKRVQPNATSLFYYIATGVLAVLQIMITGLTVTHHTFAPGIHHFGNPAGTLVGIVTWVVKLIARFSQRASLEEHFNTVEPVGLRLNPVMVFFFGGLYFQYHLNRINALKQASRFGAGRAY